MARLRKYALVRFPAGQPNNTLLPIHSLIQDHHWVRVDQDHVLMVGNYPATNHKALNEHPDVLLFPSLQASTPIGVMAAAHKKEHLLVALNALDSDHTHTSEQIVQKAIAKFGVRFEPLY